MEVVDELLYQIRARLCRGWLLAAGFAPGLFASSLGLWADINPLTPRLPPGYDHDHGLAPKALLPPELLGGK